MQTEIPQPYALFILSSIRRRSCQKEKAWKIPQLSGYILGVAIKGEGLLRIDDTVSRIKPSEVFLFTPGMTIEIMPESNRIDYYLIVLEQIALVRTRGSWNSVPGGSEFPPFPVGRIGLGDVNRIGVRVEHLYDYSRISGKGDPRAHALLQELLGLIWRDLSERDQADNEETYEGIDQSIAYMYKHYPHKITLQMLSGIAGLTPTSYSRSFKKTQSISPIEYLTRIRIGMAKDMLTRQEFSIKGVSSSVGMGNEFHFSRMFKRETGISPTMFMKRRLLKVAVASCFCYEENIRSLGVEPLLAVDCCKYGFRSIEENNEGLFRQMHEMMEAQPDFIIGDYRHAPYYERLKRIAPTVILGFHKDWRNNYLKIAELIGREKEGRENLNQLDNKVKLARKMLLQAMGNETFALMRLIHGDIRVQGMIDHPLNELIYAELGFKPGSCVPLTESCRNFSPASLPPFETDHLFIYRHSIFSDDDGFGNIQRSVFWNAMNAVCNNQTRMIPNWVRMSWCPTGRNQIIDDLLQWNA